MVFVKLGAFLILSSLVSGAYPLSLLAQPGQQWATDAARERKATVSPSQNSMNSSNTKSSINSGAKSRSRNNNTLPSGTQGSSASQRSLKIQSQLNPTTSNSANPAGSASGRSNPSAPARALIPGQSHISTILTPPELEPEKPYVASWSMQLGGQFIRDTLANQKTQAALGLNLNLEYNLTPYFALNISPRISFRNGHIQAASSTNGRENSLELINASAVFSDRNYYALSAGVLDMTQVHSGLLVASTFPAAKALISTGEENYFAANLTVLGAVPSSATVTNNSRDYDKTPSFQSVALRVKYTGSMAEALLQLSQYQYQDLPLNVSTDSTFLGNSGIGPDNSPQTEFRYRYAGQELRTALGLKLNRALTYRFTGAVVRNQEAPIGLNSGYLIGNQVDYVMNGRWTLAPTFSYFRVEPDTTVANFNDAMTTTNRVGYATGLGFHYRKQFKIAALSGEREVVFLKTSQARERFMSLSLETFDVPF